VPTAPRETRDRAALERFWRRGDGGATHVYGLADLDEPFWEGARCFVLERADGEIDAVALLLEALELPILYAVAPPGDARTCALIEALAPQLPGVFFANLPLGAAERLEPEFAIEPHGAHVKMALPGPEALARVDTRAVEPLGPADYDELAAFYAGEAYLPEERGGRFFSRYMLTLGPWFALRERGGLVAVAGLHVRSRRFGVAALGNIATRPDRRGRGLARAVTARLCEALLPSTPHLGLNVHVSNAAARRCYESLGFRERLRYDEAAFRRRAAPSGTLRA